MRKQADALKVCPIPDACLLVMAQRPYRLLGPETRSLIFLIKNSPDQVEGYVDYLQPLHAMPNQSRNVTLITLIIASSERWYDALAASCAACGHQPTHNQLAE
jgi:hypothetical protein